MRGGTGASGVCWEEASRAARLFVPPQTLEALEEGNRRPEVLQGHGVPRALERRCVPRGGGEGGTRAGGRRFAALRRSSRKNEGPGCPQKPEPQWELRI